MAVVCNRLCSKLKCAQLAVALRTPFAMSLSESFMGGALKSAASKECSTSVTQRAWSVARAAWEELNTAQPVFLVHNGGPRAFGVLGPRVAMET